MEGQVGKMPWFPFYASDFKTSTESITCHAWIFSQPHPWRPSRFSARGTMHSA
jgi:hypothetical protein